MKPTTNAELDGYKVGPKPVPPLVAESRPIADPYQDKAHRHTFDHTNSGTVSASDSPRSFDLSGMRSRAELDFACLSMQDSRGLYTIVFTLYS